MDTFFQNISGLQYVRNIASFSDVYIEGDTMSTAETIRNRVLRVRRGEPFTNTRFLKLGSRASVDKTLSRLVEEGVIQRIARGVFVRPKKSRFIGSVMPDVAKVVAVMARDHGETIQVHGAEAARRFKLSTQVPTTPVFYTSGPSRELKVGNLIVKLRHVSHRKLHLAGKRPGLALSALWYLGKNNVNANVVSAIRDGLTAEEFETLKHTDMPGWMASALERYGKEAVLA
jgi:hypothetical protein